MGSLIKTVFGGTDDSAQKNQMRQNKEVSKYVREQTAGATEDVRALSGAGEFNRNLGLSSAMDVMGQYMPQQMDTFQQGNIGAQQQLLAGLSQQQNSLLGAPTNFQSLQPTRINYDPSFTQQQLPDFRTQQPTLDNPKQLTPVEQLLQGMNLDFGSGPQF